MTRQAFLIVLTGIVSVFFGADRQAAAEQGDGQHLMTDTMASNLGLEIAWKQTLATPYGIESLVDVRLHKDGRAQQRLLELVANEGAESERVLSRIRLPNLLASAVIGEAKTVTAEEKEIRRIAANDIRRLKRRGIAATVRETKLPKIWLYALANDGSLERRDAETGKLDWRVRIGDRSLGYKSLGVGDDSVVVTNGGNLIQVVAKTGVIKEQLKLRRAELFGPTVAGDYLVVHTVGGNIEAYPRHDITIDPFREHVQGAALAAPVQSPTSSLICWPTAREFCYVMESQGSPSTLFRLHTDGIVPGGAAAATGDRFYFGSTGGMVYGVRATRIGNVMWTEAIGQPFEEKPIVAGDRVLIRSVFGSLYCLDAATGDRVWDSELHGVGGVYTALGNDLFVMTNSGFLAVVDIETGKPKPMAGRIRPERIVDNTLTNRLYMIGTNGGIQCLRPTDSPLVKLNADSQKIPTSNPSGDGSTELIPVDDGSGMTATDEQPAVVDDIFGGGGNDDNPFGGGGGDNPFGGQAAGDNPFN